MGIAQICTEFIKELVAPPRCCHCQLAGSYLCANCYEQVELLVDTNISLPSPSSLDQLVTLGQFTGPLKSLIISLKYHGFVEVSQTVAQLAFHLLDLPLANLITTVPPHPERIKLKGYSQSALITEQLAKLTGTTFENTLFRSQLLTPQASIQDKNERQQRQQNTMSVIPTQHNILTNPDLKTVLIIDDVYTTGATLNEAARALKSVNPHLTTIGLTLAHA